jgi:tetratricopeptide (TPR) repeat protein
LRCIIKEHSRIQFIRSGYLNAKYIYLSNLCFVYCILCLSLTYAQSPGTNRHSTFQNTTNVRFSITNNAGQEKITTHLQIESDETKQAKTNILTDISKIRKTLSAANEDIKNKEYEQAIPKLKWVIEEDPSIFEAWSTLGWCYWRTNQKNKCKELWERFLFLTPNEPEPYNLLGQYSASEGELSDAASYYTRSLEIDPSQYNIKYYLAKVHNWSAKYEESVAILRDLLEEDPSTLM